MSMRRVRATGNGSNVRGTTVTWPETEGPEPEPEDDNRREMMMRAEKHPYDCALRAAQRALAITAMQTLRAVPGSFRCARKSRRNPLFFTRPERYAE